MRLFRLLISAILVCSPLLAEKWTVDDVLFGENASQFELSRDARMAVWVKSQMDREKGESAREAVRDASAAQAARHRLE